MSITVAEYLTNQIGVCGKSQKDIAWETGYARPNIITMFKQGVTKVPVSAAPKLAKAIGSDPAFFLHLVLEEYHPDLLQTIEDTLGGFTTPNEAHMLHIFREVTDNQDPVLSKAAESKFKDCVKEVFN